MTTPALTDSVTLTEDEALAHLRGAFKEPVVLQTWPDVDTLLKTPTGQVLPYYSVRFGNAVTSGSKSFYGVEGDDYRVRMYVDAIAAEADLARLLSRRFFNAFNGFRATWGGQWVSRAGGGGVIPISVSTEPTEAYSVPSAYSVVVQYASMV